MGAGVSSLAAPRTEDTKPSCRERREGFDELQIAEADYFAGGVVVELAEESAAAPFFAFFAFLCFLAVFFSGLVDVSAGFVSSAATALKATRANAASAAAIVRII
jgi:hypothetical protein